MNFVLWILAIALGIALAIPVGICLLFVLSILVQVSLKLLGWILTPFFRRNLSNKPKYPNGCVFIYEHTVVDTRTKYTYDMAADQITNHRWTDEIYQKMLSTGLPAEFEVYKLFGPQKTGDQSFIAVMDFKYLKNHKAKRAPDIWRAHERFLTIKH